MATYTYRCDADGPLDVRRPIGTAPATVPCPTCGATAPRMITAPMLGLADRGRMALIDRTEASRTEPAVVSTIPGAPRPGRAAPAPRLDPRTRHLPRP
ncbi:FmdB family zinc ribbon protein [Pseudonocardia humida]|uniref:Zinc ribbon domain-containing protein n=1 Tax=Pseudonocardia humida TaxID=2800819 RepID=A0ABT1A7U9_9PSEU|nr:zinc ribbon domain-containing protein [Pseudonocardia humida]MCO1659095.1 zinc ribbon domain-containing protein [Pseudonocardia humida]